MSQDRIHDSNTVPFTMIPHEVVRDGETFSDLHEKMVYIILKSHATNGQGAFPSYKKIAEEVPCGVTKVKYCIDSLVRKKLISKRGRLKANGAQTSNLYTIEKFHPRSPDDQGGVTTWQGAGHDVTGDQSPRDYEEESFKNNPLSNSSSSESAINHSDDLSKLVSFFQKEIGMASGYVIDDIQHTLAESSYELIQYALEQSVLNDARNWKYAKAIVRNLADKKLFTLEAIQLHESKRSTSRSTKGFGRNRRNAPDMEEPAWVAKEKEEQQAFEKQKKQELESNVPDDSEVQELLRSLHQD